MQTLKEYLVIVVFFLVSCNIKENSSASAPDLFADTSTYFKIYENPLQKITLNGNPIELDNLEKRLASLKTNNGIILYSNGIGSTPPTSGQLFELIKQYKLSIKMFTDSTFKKSVD